MDMAIKLIDALTVPWNPDQYHDTYTEDLTRLIREKIEGIERQEQEEEPSPAEVTDLYVRLSESVQMAQEKQHPRR